jgi:division protein CdvB (Snf7/Vps24/ESCRT-III family)
VKVLAKEIANTRRTVERMYMAKAQLNSVSSSLQTSMCEYPSRRSYLYSFPNR